MNTLKAQKRDMGIKAKKLRREGYITGVLYGREINPSIPLQMDRKETEKSLRGCKRGTQILLDVEGKVYNVLIKEMDYDASKNQMLEIDFQALVSNEKVHSVAEIILHNKDKVQEGVLEQHLEEVAYKAYPSALVDRIVIDVSEMHVGDSVQVKDLDIAKNDEIDLSTDLEASVVSVSAIHVKEEATAEAETAEETAE